jgi:hypothetical protein
MYSRTKCVPFDDRFQRPYQKRPRLVTNERLNWNEGKKEKGLKMNEKKYRTRSSGDGVEGVCSEEEKLLIRFWHLFGSSKRCAKARGGEFFADVEKIEAAVVRLARIIGFNTTVDVPQMLSEAPELLLIDAEVILKRIAMLYTVLPGLRGEVIGKHCARMLLIESDVLKCKKQELINEEILKWYGGCYDQTFVQKSVDERLRLSPNLLLS